MSVTGTVSERDLQAQFLDNMDLERERGITIKLQAARMPYFDTETNEHYILNLIDTPGHVDFAYEVSRSLAACEGALLVVDAAQGVEAQTLANVYLALENDLEIIPVLNKIDLPGAEPDRVKSEIEEMVGLDCSDAVLTSAKAGIGMEELLKAIVKRVPPPSGREEVGEKETTPVAPKALIFDSYFDPYRGVIIYCRVVDGCLRAGEKVILMNTGKEFVIEEIGIMSPGQIKTGILHAGEVGYIAGGIKRVGDARVGDTITSAKQSAEAPLSGYSEASPMVFCGLFPSDSDDYPTLRDAMGKLQLNDAALTFEPETSSAMGFGFRCGFLGLLHMEIVQERLEREFDLDLITTAPSVVYHVYLLNGDMVKVANPADLPLPEKRKYIEEPICRIEIITPKDFVGAIMELAQSRRGEFKDMQYLTETRTSLVYELPLSEIVTDFFDELKGKSKGYASMEYHVIGYEKSKLEKLDILIAGDRCDPMAIIVHQDNAYRTGRQLCTKLKDLIPRQQFKISIQAALGNNIIASCALSALRKDVLAKCYGGDISRKKKLLKKQAAGKKRLKQFGKVDVPQDAFMAVLKLNKGEGA